MNAINKYLKEIIEQSSFEVEEGRFIYAKVRSSQDINKHFVSIQFLPKCLPCHFGDWIPAFAGMTLGRTE